MLCFLFAALIVALDQFFKHWILRTLDIGDVGPEVIPGLLGLTRWENDGAMLNILSGQQWLLAGIAFVAAVVLIMILLRYNEGFWGTLGLAAVLGGTIGNLADRVLNDGKVVDMFKTIPFEFPIFNIADIFITLGFLTFLIHFIVLTVKGEKKEASANEYDDDDYGDEYDDADYDEFPEIDTNVAAQSEYVAPAPRRAAQPQPQPQQPQRHRRMHIHNMMLRKLNLRHKMIIPRPYQTIQYPVIMSRLQIQPRTRHLHWMHLKPSLVLWMITPTTT